MWKNFFILYLVANLYSNTLETIDNADIAFARYNYIKAIKLYEKVLKTDKNNESVRLKLISCYIKLGNNFKKVNNFEKSLYWYKKALYKNSLSVKLKIASVYKKQAKLYIRVKKYKKALLLYQKALKLGDKKVKRDIKKLKRVLVHKKKLKNDSRKLVTSSQIPWTQAVGRVIIPTKLTFVTKKRYRTKYKKCSSSLVDDGTHSSSRVVLTASHCLKGYDKDAGFLRYIIKTSSNDMIQKYLSIYKDSHYSVKKLKTNSDYAILILDSAISTKDVKPLVVSKTKFTKLQKQYKYSYASLAGFSSDVGDYGARLTMDKRCKLFNYTNTYGKSSCTAYKGASGGPIVLNVSNNNKDFQHYLVGVVSFFRNGNFNNIYFAPNNQFYDDLEIAIKDYNK